MAQEKLALRLTMVIVLEATGKHPVPNSRTLESPKDLHHFSGIDPFNLLSLGFL